MTLENGFRIDTVCTMKNNNNKNISDLKNANRKKDAVSSIYPRCLTYCNYISVTEKSSTYDILSGRVSDSGARGPGFETYRRRVVSLSKTLYSPKVLVNYPGSDGSVPT